MASFLKQLLQRLVKPKGPLMTPGARAPVLLAKNHNEGTIDLAKLYNNSILFLYFYPKAYTPCCRSQAESIRDYYATIRARGVEVVGVTTDTPAAIRSCRNRTRLPFLLIADEEGELARAFGVPMHFGFASQCGFIIRSGIIIWRSEELPVEGLGPELIAILDRLKIQEKS